MKSLGTAEASKCGVRQIDVRCCRRFLAGLTQGYRRDAFLSGPNHIPPNIVEGQATPLRGARGQVVRSRHARSVRECVEVFMPADQLAVLKAAEESERSLLSGLVDRIRREGSTEGGA
jgi:hypothetical protein